MLAAAIGSQLDNVWSRYWLIFGTLGLVSAIGLYVLSQARARAEEMNRRIKASLQIEKNVNKIVDIEESFDAIISAVRYIQLDIAEMGNHPLGAGAETRMAMLKPVTITPVGELPGLESESFVGTLRNISSRGFSLAHDHFLERGYVLLLFAFENHKPIQLIADILWCEHQSGGQYFSGGKFLELVSSDETGSLKPDYAQAHGS